MKPITVLCIALVAFASGSVRARPGDAAISARAVERRAVEAAIWGMPAVNYDLMLQEMLTKTAGKVNQVIYWGKPLDWHNQTLTPNPDTLYLMAFFNTRDAGPIVVEIPPADDGGSLNANFVNIWQEPLEDIGPLGADKGKGAKLLILPPDYKDKAPEGYLVIQPRTWGSYALLRSNMKSHGEADVAASIAYGKRVKVYPLSQAAKEGGPPATVFTDVKDVDFDSTIRYDVRFFEGLNRVVQSEPWLERDGCMIDPLRTLGIERGKPFAPDAAMKKGLEAGVKEAKALLEARYDAGQPAFFDGTHWMFPASPELVAFYSGTSPNPDIYPIDARGVTYTYAFIAIKRMGQGQFYLINIKDKSGKSYDGSRTYVQHIPAGAPVEQYWSLTAYDRETHALIKGVDRASRASNSTEVQRNADGSVDLFIGPRAPAGKESNWIPTDPSRQFELMFRFYAPTKALFEKTWALPDVEQVE